MHTQPSLKTIICRDCGYQMTTLVKDKGKTPVTFCERCGGQHLDISSVEGLAWHHPMRFIKELLHTKLF